MDIELTVRVRGQYFSGGASVTVPELVTQCFEPMRMTDIPEMALTGETFYTSPVANRITLTRKEAADVLADVISKMIVSEMKKGDTFNGYKEGES